jgi:PAS domain S-box-containing protein
MASPGFIHGVAFDISESKRAEEALAKSEEMLQGLFDFAPDTIAVVDHRGSIVRINAQVEKMFGYAPRELAGLSIETLMPERYRSSHSKQRRGTLLSRTRDLWVPGSSYPANGKTALNSQSISC